MSERSDFGNCRNCGADAMPEYHWSGSATPCCEVCGWMVYVFKERSSDGRLTMVWYTYRPNDRPKH